MKFRPIQCPREMDGLALPEDLAERFSKLIAVLQALDPTKPSDGIVRYAETVLRATCQRTPRGWTSLRGYALNNGRGPVLRFGPSVPHG